MDAKRTSLFMLPWISLLPTCGIAITPSDGQAFFQLSIGEARAETGSAAAAQSGEASVARRGGSKIRDKIVTGKTIKAKDVTGTQSITTTLGPNSTDGRKRGAPKGDVAHGIQSPTEISEEARHRGPKGGGRDKEDTGRTIQATAAATPQTITTIEGLTGTDGQRREGPKPAGCSGLQQPADSRGNQAISTTLGPNGIEGNKGGGPKGDGDSGMRAPTVISGEARPRGPKIRTKESTN